MQARVTKTDQEWRAQLTDQQYRVLRKAATERPFTGEYVNRHDDGMYHCAACDAALFSSDAKFESGTGWPSFTEPAVAERLSLSATGSPHPPHRGPLPAMRIPPGPRLRRWSRSQRAAILHQLCALQLSPLTCRSGRLRVRIEGPATSDTETGRRAG